MPASFRLSSFRPVGLKEHRAGWPAVVDALRAHAGDDVHLPFLDDFVDASFTYDGSRLAHCDHTRPWVGIFHHPLEVSSPLKADAQMTIRHLFHAPRIRKALPSLIGCVALCPHVAEYLAQELKVPVLTQRHPMSRNVRQWRYDSYLEEPAVLQSGFFLRNTRFVHLLRLD